MTPEQLRRLANLCNWQANERDDRAGGEYDWARDALDELADIFRRLAEELENE